MDLLVTYDIDTRTRSGQRRLQRVAKVCEGYGLRVQYSVFECRLDGASRQRLENELLDVIQPALDQVNLYDIPGAIAACRRTLGRPLRYQVDGHWFV